MCECFIGCNGSPCAQKFVLWSENIGDSASFIPFTSKNKPERFTCIAVGTALSTRFYESLHSSARAKVDALDFFEEIHDVAN